MLPETGPTCKESVEVWRLRSAGRTTPRTSLAAIASSVLATGLLLLPSDALTLPARDAQVGSTAGVASDTVPQTPFYEIVLRRPGQLSGRGFGTVTVAFPATPFNVAVTGRGHYVYDLGISSLRLPWRQGVVHMVWVASADLERIDKVGAIGRDESLSFRVDFANKFLVFISEEPSTEVEQPQGRIVARGTSRSGRMDGMFAHGFCPPDAVC